MSSRSPNIVDTPILLGTGNPAKQDTLRWMLEGLLLTPTTPATLGLKSSPDEEGDTHQVIAERKAMDWSKSAAMLAIASDGGLALPVLGRSWESRYTHRFAGPAADDAQRVQRLLELLEPYKEAQREATWVEAVAIADKGKLLASWQLNGATGVIAHTPDDNLQQIGFWAFSVWYFPELGKTYNQLSLEEKEGLEDHWVNLRRKVQAFFSDNLSTSR